MSPRPRRGIAPFVALLLLATVPAFGDDPPDADQLFLRGAAARRGGHAEHARIAFRAALAADPDHTATRNALGQVKLDGKWVARTALTARQLTATVEAKVVAARNLERLVRAYGDATARERKSIRVRIARIDDRRKPPAMLASLDAPSVRSRSLAARELGRMKHAAAFPALLRLAVDDTSSTVRKAAIDAAKAIDEKRAVRTLVERIEAHGGGAPRVHAFFGGQLAFVQDFDVEVG